MTPSLTELYPVHLTPGGPSLSRKLLLTCPDDILLRENASLLLAGCRYGEHLFTLAEHFAGRLTGIDEDAEAVLYGKMAIRQSGYSDRLNIINSSPLATRFRLHSFDIIVLEGTFSAYPAGKILKEVSRLLSDGGIVLFSDSCWLQEDVPVFARQVWEAQNHKIMTVDKTAALFTERGFKVLFTEDHSSVLNNYYSQFHDEAHNIVRGKFEGMRHLKGLIKKYKHEIDVYHKHGGKRFMGYMTLAATPILSVKEDQTM